MFQTVKRLARVSLVGAIALSLPVVAAADDPDLTVYGEGAAPLKKPEMRLKPVPAYNLQSQLFDFPTGLRILMQPDNTHPVVTVHTIVGHGSSDDFEGKEGLAHFVEHTWFKSEHTFVEPITGKETKLPKIMDVQGDIGALMNASTRSDYTDYMTTASVEFLDLLMQYESWRLKHPYRGVKADEIKVETEVIINEWRRRNEQGSNLIWDYAQATVFPQGHPYARSSTKETLDAIELEDLQKYFDMYYTPDKTTIVVVGDFDPLEASSLIFANFDWELLDPALDRELDYWQAPKPGLGRPADPNRREDWLVGAFDPSTRGQPASERKRYEYVDAKTIAPRVPRDPDTRPPPPPGSRELLVRQAPIDKNLAVAIWSLPAGYRSDENVMGMLGSLANMVIYPQLDAPAGQPDPMPDISFEGCGIQPQAENTMMFCAAGFDPKKTSPENAIDKVVNQISQMWNPDYRFMLQQVFERARNEYLRDLLFQVDKVADPFTGRPSLLVEYLHFTGDAQVVAQRMTESQTIQFDSVAAMAQKYLLRDRYASLHIKPLPKKDRDTKAEGSPYAGASADDLVFDTREGLLEQYDRDAIAASWVKPHLEGVEDFKLPNGMRVIAIDHGEVPVVSSALMLGGGTAMSPARMFSFYSQNRDFEYVDLLPIAAESDYVSFEEAERLRVTSLTGNLDGALWYLRNSIDTMTPDTTGLRKWVKDGKKATQKSWSSRGWHLSDIVTDKIYPGHPRSKSMSLADWDQYAEWGKPKLDQLMKKKLQPSNATLIVVGRVDVDEVKRLAFETFSSWENKGVEPDFQMDDPPGPPTPGQKVVLADNDGVTQSTVSGVCRLNYQGPEDQPAVEVLSSLVGNDTFSTLRVKEGLAYSPGGFAGVSADGSATLRFSVLATNAGVGRVVEFMQDWVEDAAKGGFDEEEVLLHKLRQARESGLQAQSVSQLNGVLSYIVRKGWTFDEYLQTGDRIASVSDADLARLMDGCADHFTVTIDGPKDVLTPLLGAKSIEFEVLDWKARRKALYEAQDPKGYKKLLKAEAKAEKKKAKRCAKDPEAEGCDDVGDDKSEAGSEG